ncbi:MAG: hypothetical protein ACRDDF_02330, partial [Aeromonas sp.]
TSNRKGIKLGNRRQANEAKSVSNPQNRAKVTADPIGTATKKVVIMKIQTHKQKEKESIYKILDASLRFQSRVFICDVRMKK